MVYNSDGVPYFTGVNFTLCQPSLAVIELPSCRSGALYDQSDSNYISSSSNSFEQVILLDMHSLFYKCSCQPLTQLFLVHTVCLSFLVLIFKPFCAHEEFLLLLS